MKLIIRLLALLSAVLMLLGSAAAQTKLDDLAELEKQIEARHLQLQQGRAQALKEQIADLEAQNKTLRAQIAANEEALYNLKAELGAIPGALGGIVRYSATTKGFISDVTTTVELDGMTIVAITVDASGETAVIGVMAAEPDYLDQFIGLTGPFTLGENVDAATGATFTSVGVIEAVNNALGY